MRHQPTIRSGPSSPFRRDHAVLTDFTVPQNLGELDCRKQPPWPTYQRSVNLFSDIPSVILSGQCTVWDAIFALQPYHLPGHRNLARKLSHRSRQHSRICDRSATTLPVLGTALPPTFLSFPVDQTAQTLFMGTDLQIP